MKRIILLLLISLCALNIYSQKGTIRGFVSDKNTKEPIIFCNVFLENTRFGIQTDLNGMYTLSKIPEGKYRVSATYIGYEKLSQEITIQEGEIVTLRFELNKSTIKIDEIEISNKIINKVNYLNLTRIN